MDPALDRRQADDDLTARVVEALAGEGVLGQGVTVGLSGGVDSIALLDLFCRIREQDSSSFPVLAAIHVHHGLSLNADDWLAFCARVCRERDVAFDAVRVVVDAQSGSGRGLGPEGAARAARYQAFQRVATPNLALAHHRDDQAETVLHQLLRGTGWKGAAGMAYVRTLGPKLRLIRPLLCLTRVELLAYATRRRLEWIEDESNSDTTMLRNYLRHEILPGIEARFPQYRDALARMARLAAETDLMLEELARIDLQWCGEEAEAGALDALPRARQVNALYHWLGANGIPAPAQAQLEEWARQLFRPQPAGKVHQAGGHELTILRKGSRMILRRGVKTG